MMPQLEFGLQQDQLEKKKYLTFQEKNIGSINIYKTSGELEIIDGYNNPIKVVLENKNEENIGNTLLTFPPEFTLDISGYVRDRYGYIYDHSEYKARESTIYKITINFEE